MSGIFGKSTTPPAGFSDVPNPNPAVPPIQQQQGGGEQGHFTQQTGMPEQRQDNVPAFEGAESGNVTESQPVTHVNQQQGPQVNQQQQPPQVNQQQAPHVNQQQPPQVNQQQPPQVQQQQTPAMDAVALEVKQAALDAREAKLMAQETRLANQNNLQNTPEEPPPSLLADIEEESLESEGERTLFKVAQQLETQLNETKKTADAAVKSADDMRADQIIQSAIAQYGVTREELDQAYQQTGNPDVNLLAQSILWRKSQTAQSQEQTQQGLQTQHVAHQERVQSVQNITGAPGAPGATRTYTPPPRRGVTNPYDGEQVARVYRAFE